LAIGRSARTPRHRHTGSSPPRVFPSAIAGTGRPPEARYRRDGATCLGGIDDEFGTERAPPSVPQPGSHGLITAGARFLSAPLARPDLANDHLTRTCRPRRLATPNVRSLLTAIVSARSSQARGKRVARAARDADAAKRSWRRLSNEHLRTSALQHASRVAT